MKYFIIFVVMSVAGTLGVVKNDPSDSRENFKKIPVEYIDFEPLIIQAGQL